MDLINDLGVMGEDRYDQEYYFTVTHYEIILWVKTKTVIIYFLTTFNTRFRLLLLNMASSVV